MILKEFIAPPHQYRPSPVWTWNSEMEPTEIETQIRDMRKKGFGGFFIHSGKGLKTEYMDDDWMKAVLRALGVASELKIEAWLYDEDRSPSGYSGGKTTKSNSEIHPTALIWSEDASSLESDIIDKAIAFTVKDAAGKVEITRAKPDNISGVGVFYEKVFSKGQPRYNGATYSDLLNPKAVKSFIDNTYEKYAKKFKKDITGFFTYEPNVNRSKKFLKNEDQTQFSFPWTNGFAKYFKELHGYSPIDHLHHLISNSEDGFKFRHDFWLAINELFIETFLIPLTSWCKEHNVLLAGSFYSGDKFLDMILSGGSVMANYEYMNLPGISSHGPDICNPQSAKQVSSVANQLGRKRVLGKVLGSSGYSMSFEDIKHISDFHNSLGINYISPHHVKYSIVGDLKNSELSSFSYHQPYWDNFKVMNDYISRCSWAVSQGNDTASVLLMAPFVSAYGSCDINSEDGGETVKSIENCYKNIIKKLLEEHIAFDIGDERILKRHGSVSGDTLNIGNAKYKSVILPYSATWKSSTLDFLDSFDGQVIIMGDIPTRVDGKLDDRCSALSKKENHLNIPDNPSKAVESIVSKFGRMVSVKLDNGSEASGILVNHRLEAAAHILFLANTDRKKETDVTIILNALGGVVELDPITGRAYRYNSEVKDNQTVIKTRLSSSGSKIFLVDQTQTSINASINPSNKEFLRIEGPYAFERLNDNSLTIDRCKLEIDDKTILENAPVSEVKNAIWDYTGIAEYQDYQSWVIKEKNIRSKTNKTELTFNFTVKDLPEKISLAMESSDRFKIEINGTEIDYVPGNWYIDRQLRVLNIEDHLVEGVNTIKAATDFLWDTEIENIYIFGDFAVGTEEEGFPIIKEPETIKSGNWVTQGYPFYSGSMSYKIDFSLNKEDSARYEIDLSNVSGSTSSLVVNETEIGLIPFSPFKGEITDALKEGENKIEIIVCGSLGNALGPFHKKVVNDNLKTETEQLNEETNSYEFTSYGLSEPPKLVIIK